MIRITDKEIREIVREEIIDLLLEANPYHDKETGRLSGPNAGNVYSITDPASQKYGNEAKKGIVGANKRLGYKFGMTKCGRRLLSGQDVSPSISCSKYPKKYWNKDDKKVDEAMILGDTDITDVSINDDNVMCVDITDVVRILKHHQDRMINEGSDVNATCRSLGYTTFQDLIRSMDAMAKASKGEFIQVPKK